MRWFEGDISTAINISKTQKSLFVVLVGEDFTEEEDAIWNDSSIDEIVNNNKCICLNLKAGSQHANQFSQIYPIIIHPTIYFIGNNGQPLEIKVGKSSLDELKQSFMKAIELHGDAKSGEQTIGSLPSGEVVESSALPNNGTDKLNPEEETEMITKTLAEENAEKVAEGSSLPSNEVEKLSLEERSEIAIQKLAEQNAEKAAKEFEESKMKELERRRLGQEMNKLKEFKEDVKRRELEREMRRKKEEDSKARERIRREIELDREERAKKYYDGKSSEQRLESERKLEREAMQNKKQGAENANKMEFARIQFKLPNGSSLNNQFSSSDLLSSAKTFILEKLDGSYDDVTLSKLHPRVTFDSGDYDKTFLELNLAPSVVLIVLPKKSPSVSNRSTNILMYLFSQMMFLYQFLMNLIFPNQDALGNVQEERPSPANPESSQSSPNYGGARPKVYGHQSQGIRQRKDGNIHRLMADDDDDDEQATWNGNSTQQM